MLSRSFLAACLLAAACAGLAVALRQRDEGHRAEAAPAARVLPGVRPGGEVLLPNQWSLRPAGKQVALGDFPVNLALHPDGHSLAVLHAGYGTHEVVLVDLTSGREKVTCRVPLPQ